MSKSRLRSCPRCGVAFAVTVAQADGPEDSVPIAGQCTECGYELAWRVFVGKAAAGRGSSRTRAVRTFALITLIFVAAATLVRCAVGAREDPAVHRAG